MDRLQKAPERAEQAEEDEEADEIAVELAPFVEPGADRIEDRPRRRRREAARAGARVDERRHRAEQAGVALRGADLRGAQRIDPADLAVQADDLAEGENSADQEDA